MRLPVLLAAVCLALSPAAIAAPAPDVGGEAARLLSDVEARQAALSGGEAPAVDAAFEARLAGFARDAQALSDALRKTGPDDLACIFNGIAEDAARQLVALKSGGDAGEAYRRLVALLADARDFAPAAKDEAGQNDDAGIPCEADPGAVEAYLKSLRG